MLNLLAGDRGQKGERERGIGGWKGEGNEEPEEDKDPGGVKIWAGRAKR